MTPRHRVSRAAIDLIKRFEGYRRKAAQLPDGRWTIGYGHTLTARQGAEVSEQDAEALLLYDLIAVAHGVNEGVYTPLNQHQFDALCAFAFNIGAENFRGSVALRKINSGALLQGAASMELWRKAEFAGEQIVVDGLVRRRAAEKALFLTPIDGLWPAVPTPVLPPRLDVDIEGVVPVQAPVVVTTNIDGERLVVEREAGLSEKPLTPIEDDGPSPLQKAAASVTSRLQNFFRSPERRSNVTPMDFGRRPEAAARGQPASVGRFEGDHVLTLTPPDEDDLAGQPAIDDHRRLDIVAANETPPGLFDSQFSSANDQAPVSEPADGPAAAQAPAVDLQSSYAAAHAAETSRPEPGLPLLVTLAAAGMTVFAGSLYWFFNTWGGPNADLIGHIAVWIACFAGIGCFSLAAYLMLERLGRAAGDLGDE